jgi:hypothetical protein
MIDHSMIDRSFRPSGGAEAEAHLGLGVVPDLVFFSVMND